MHGAELAGSVSAFASFFDPITVFVELHDARIVVAVV